MKLWAEKSNKRAFTLVEVMISVAVASMILILIFYVFSSNMQSWRQGESKMVLQSEISRIMAFMYGDIKRINPAIFYDMNHDLWVTGERYKEAKPNEVELIDENREAADGFERLKFRVYYIDPYSKKETVEYYLKRDPNSMTVVYIKNKTGTAYMLMRNCDGRETTVSENVESIKFTRDPKENRAFTVSVKVNMPADSDGRKRSDSFDLKIRFDNEYVILKEIAAQM